MIPAFVEQLMNKCKNRRCRRAIIDNGYCQDCYESRQSTIDKAAEYYTTEFILQGLNPPTFALNPNE